MLLAFTHHIAADQLGADDNLTDSHFPHFLLRVLRPTREDSKFCFFCENLQLEKNPRASPNMHHIDQLLLQSKDDSLPGAFGKAFPLIVTLMVPGSASADIFIFLFFQVSTTETSDLKLQYHILLNFSLKIMSELCSAYMILV